MRRGFASLIFLLAGLAPSSGQTALEARTKVDFPPDVLAYFRANMHKRMTDLNAVVAFVADGQFKDAAKVMAEGLAIQGNHPPGAPRPGQYVPPEFRALDQVTHQAAGVLAKTLMATASPPSTADYSNIFTAMSALTATCSGCHGVYRIH